MREWNRAALKKKAREGIRGYYWAAVIVSFILGILGISAAATGFGETERDEFLGALGIGQNAALPENSQADAFLSGWDTETIIILGLALLSVFAVMAVVGFVVRVLALNAIAVSSCRFYLEGQRGQKPGIDMLLWGFKSGGYGNIVKTMFIRDIKETLWFLLLIVPGIVKTYEYRMIPYILAENPRMRSKEVFAASRQMMKGNKWKAFVFDLSFLGWLIVAFIAGCVLRFIPILGDMLSKVPQLCVTPYIDAAGTELYMALKMDETE